MVTTNPRNLFIYFSFPMNTNFALCASHCIRKYLGRPLKEGEPIAHFLGDW